jgi:Flp pilus assembly pilin Flp
MRKFAVKLWRDDVGAVIASEYLFISTLLVVGIIVGLSSIRDAVTSEMAELGNSYMALSQGYWVSGQIGCCSGTDGSQAIDTPYWIPNATCTANVIPSSIDYWRYSTLPHTDYGLGGVKITDVHVLPEK